MIGHRQMTFDDYVAIARRRKWYIIVPTILGPILAFALCLVIPSQYTSQTLVLVAQPTVPESYVKPVVSTDLNQRLATMQQQILSRSRLEPVINEFGLYKNEIGKVPMEELVARLQKLIVVTPIEPMAETTSKELPGFYVKVTFSNAHLAQQICAEVTSMFMQENLQLRQDQAQDTTDFLSKQLDDAKTKLDAQDAKLADFKRHYLGSLPDDEQTNLNLLMGLNTQLEAATQALGRAQQDKTFAESTLATQLSAWQASQTGKDPQTLDKALAEKESQLIDLKSRYTDDYPDVIKVKNDIAQLKKQIAAAPPPATPDQKAMSAKVEPPQIQQLRAQVHQYDEMIRQETAQQADVQRQIRMYQARVQLSPVVEEQYKEMTRDYQTALDMYNDLLKKRSQSAMATDLERRQESEQFRVLDAANLPDRPSFPNRPLFTFGGLAFGLGLGIGIALLLEMRDTTLRSERDVEFFLKLPMLAIVPALEVTVSHSRSGHSGNGNGNQPAFTDSRLGIRG